MTDVSDRCKQRTRKAIIKAFNELFLEGELDEIRVADIVARANVGRSTFYEHFANARQVFLTTFSCPLSILAAALAGPANKKDLEMLLDHLWENRYRARKTFSGRSREQISRLLRQLVSERCLQQDPHLHLSPVESVARTEQTLGLIRAWRLGELDCSRAHLVQVITRTSVPRN